MLDKVLKLSDEDLEKYRINPKDYLDLQQEKSETKEKAVANEKTTEMKPINEQKPEQSQNEFKQLNTSHIPDSEYQKYGIKTESLEGELKAMGYGYKSPNLVDITPNIEGVDYRIKARLSLEEQANGSIKIYPIHYSNKLI